MENKQKIILVSFGIILIFGIVIVAIQNPRIFGIKSDLGSGNNISPTNIENKIYKVKEIANLLKTNPNSLKDKSVKIEAYVVDSVRGIECEDYQILTDKEYVEAFKKRYDNKFSQDERDKAIEESKQAPVLLTGETLTLPRDFFPTGHAVYQGHFYDNWATKTCGADGWKRFVIEKKIEEITSEKNLEQNNSQDEPANWKTYRNEQFGFTLRYPADYYPIEDKNFLNIDFIKEVPINKKCLPDTQCIDSFQKLLFSVGIEDSQNKNINEIYKKSVFYKDNPQTLLKTENITIAGNPALKATFCIEGIPGKGCQGSTENIYDVIVLHNNNFYTFEGSEAWISKVLFEKILDSVAFFK